MFIELVLKGTPTVFLRLAHFLLETGLRIGEALFLTWDCVDFEKRLLHVSRSKTGQSRTEPMSSRCYTTLKTQEAKRSTLFDAEAVFVWPNVAHRTFSRLLHDLETVEKVTPHILRHTFATRMAQRGIQIETLSRILGHSNIAMTMRYAHHGPKQLEAAREMME